MNISEAIFLGMIQGISEFLPISSTAHVILFSKLFKISIPDSAFFIFLNIGTLLALIFYYFHDVWKLFLGALDFIFLKKTNNRELFLTLFLSSLPVFIIFGIAEIIFDFKLEAPLILASSMIIFAIILYFCDQKPTTKTNVNRRDSILTGIAQVASIIPGVSRLGACLSMMRYCGYARIEAFRYSMILSLPPVVGACFLKFLKVAIGKIVISDWNLIIFGCISAFIFGLLTLNLINFFLKKFSLLPLVIYRIFFGFLLLYLHTSW